MFELSLDFFMTPLQIIVFLYTFAYFLISLPGFFPVRQRKLAEPKHSFAIVIPAHNEAQVIGPLLDSIARQRYPDELYRVFVIADNCSDDTAAIAAAHGALAYQRSDESNRSKGHALKWFFEQLWERPETYDAVVVFDADNLVDAEFLLQMNDHLCSGEQVIQGYIDSKNPEDSWIASAFSLGFWIANRLQLARYRIGVSTPLFGTGMCISTAVLQDVGWSTKTLTEDLEFTMQAILKGYKTTWAHQAIIYDERVTTAEACWKQQIRWQQGRFEVVRDYLPTMFKGCLKGDADKLEATLNLFSSIFVLLSGFLGVMSFLRAFFPTVPFFQFTPLMSLGLAAFLGIAQFIAPFLVLLVDRRPKRYLLWIPFYSAYMVFWTIVTAAALLNFKERHWTHTQHRSSISIEDLEARIDS